MSIFRICLDSDSQAIVVDYLFVYLIEKKTPRKLHSHIPTEPLPLSLSLVWYIDRRIVSEWVCKYTSEHAVAPLNNLLRFSQCMILRKSWLTSPHIRELYYSYKRGWWKKRSERLRNPILLCCYFLTNALARSLTLSLARHHAWLLTTKNVRYETCIY